MFAERTSNIAKNAAGLAIKTSSSPIAKTANTIQYSINGNMYSKAAADVALSTELVSGAAPTILAGNKAVFTVQIDASGAFSVVKGDEVLASATLTISNVKAYKLNQYAKVGYIIVSNGTASTFTGGTTALDTASLTVTYIDAFVAQL